MTELKKIEAGLVPVYETSTGEKVVYGTELHDVLGVKSNYRDWSKNRLKDIDAIENEDYEPAKILASSGQNKKEHIIKLDIAKEMAMLERNEKGKQVRRYFIQVEKKYKAAQEIVAKQLQDILRFIEQQENFNQLMLEKINCLQILQGRNIEEDSISVCVEEESESERRKKMLNQLVNKMAKACDWNKNFALHRLYKALENVLDISLDDYMDIHEAETGNPCVSTLDMVTTYDRLYKTAVRLCTNTINEMKC